MGNSKTPEGGLKKDMLDYLDTLGAVVLPMSTGMFKAPGGVYKSRNSSKGRADIIMLYNTLPIAIEVKTKDPDSKQNKDQMEWESRWVSNGGIYWVVRSLDALKNNFLELVRSYG